MASDTKRAKRTVFISFLPLVTTVSDVMNINLFQPLFFLTRTFVGEKEDILMNDWNQTVVWHHRLP